MHFCVEGFFHSEWSFREYSMLLPAIKIYSFWQLSSINTSEFVFHSLMDGHLWYLQVWPRLNKTAMNTLVQNCLCVCKFSFLLSKYLGIKPLSRDRYVYSVWEITWTCPKVRAFIFSTEVEEISRRSRSLLTFEAIRLFPFYPFWWACNGISLWF